MSTKRVLSITPSIIVLSLGIVGNLINVLVFAKKEMRASSTFRFLIYLSISDLMVMIINSTEILFKSDFSFRNRESSLVSCNIQKFLSYTIYYISSCLSVAVSVDRALIVCKLSPKRLESKQASQALATSSKIMTSHDEKMPSSKKTSQEESPKITFSKMTSCKQKQMNSFNSNSNASISSNKRRTVLVDRVMALIVVSMLLLNSHFLILLKPSQALFVGNASNESYTSRTNKFSERGVNENEYDILECAPKRNTYYEMFLLHVWFAIDLCMYSILPFACTSVCSAIIIHKLKQMNTFYRDRLTSNNFNRKIYLKKLKRNFQISAMLIVTNAYFLLSMLVFWVWFMLHLSERETYASNLRQSFVYILLFTNNAFDCLFYGLSSAKYRSTLRGIFKRQRRLSSKNKIKSNFNETII